MCRLISRKTQPEHSLSFHIKYHFVPIFKSCYIKIRHAIAIRLKFIEDSEFVLIFFTSFCFYYLKKIFAFNQIVTDSINSCLFLFSFALSRKRSIYYINCLLILISFCFLFSGCFIHHQNSHNRPNTTIWYARHGHIRGNEAGWHVST